MRCKYLNAVILTILIFTAGCYKPNSQQNPTSPLQNPPTVTQGKSPCSDTSSATYRTYNRERIDGYQQDLPLQTAIEQFNNCNDLNKNLEQPLASQEIEAAVANALTEAIAKKRKFSLTVVARLQRILAEKIMPKGMFISINRGYESPDYEVSQTQIFLDLEMDKYPNSTLR